MFYTEMGVGYMIVLNCQNSTNKHLRSVHFTVYTLHPQKRVTMTCVLRRLEGNVLFPAVHFEIHFLKSRIVRCMGG